MDAPKDYVHGTKCCTHPSRKQVGCRKALCDTKFSVRFDGLEDSLTYRIYGLLWNEVIIELDNGRKNQGSLNFCRIQFRGDYYRGTQRRSSA